MQKINYKVLKKVNSLTQIKNILIQQKGIILLINYTLALINFNRLNNNIIRKFQINLLFHNKSRHLHRFNQGSFNQGSYNQGSFNKGSFIQGVQLKITIRF